MSHENEEIIKSLTKEISENFAVSEIYLVSQKLNVKGKLTSFKICVIISDNDSKSETETLIMTEVDCEIPFEVIAYKQSEWERYSKDNTSFAGKILKEGTNLREQS
ncbi:MAG: hypothetical protein LBM87_08745 [Ruminococcus sp.]|jgi:hypothetical protein|nr:hypothetical protein [Ruminococcus sp.]